MSIFKSILNWMDHDTDIDRLFQTYEIANFKGEVRRGTFSDFMHEFKKREWTRSNNNDWLCTDGSHIHLKLIQFSGVAMLLEGNEYRMFREWTLKQPSYMDIKKDQIRNWNSL